MSARPPFESIPANANSTGTVTVGDAVTHCMRLPSASLPPGPVAAQVPAYNLLLQFMRLHRHQVASSGADGELLRPPHVLLSGARGCGKSHLSRQAAVASGLPWLRADLSRYAVAGQPGRSLEHLLQNLADSSEVALDPTMPVAVVVLEGLERELGAGSSERSRALQSEIASLLDGRDLPVRLNGRTEQVSSRRILFILTFTQAPANGPRRALGFGASHREEREASAPDERLLEAGVHQSIIDLSANHVPVGALEERDLAELLLREDSALTGVRRLFAEHGIALEFAQDARGWLARQALVTRGGGHGLGQVVGSAAARLVPILPGLPEFIATVRVTEGFLAGTQDSPEGFAGVRQPVRSEKVMGAPAVPAHPEFPEGTLPHRPTRPTNTGASSQGRLANRGDLERWLVPDPGAVAAPGNEPEGVVSHSH